MSIEVHVRIRPSAGNCVWSSAETVLYSTANTNTRYVYNKVHPSNSSNESIFHGVEAIVHAAFDGKNVTIMAYGQTGSGKTHSMIGLEKEPGVVPRAARLLLELKKNTPGTTIHAYYTEIYNESVKDLLEPQRGELALHDAPDGGVMYEKKMIEVKTYDDFIQLQAAAERNRKYGVTNLNEHSSRSHIILTFEIHRHNRAGKSVVNLVDLAGSESAARANTEGLSLREGGFINKSLLTLGNVVDAIVDKRPYIPYRDAKLTRILRSCLGGSGITLILCCINPSRENFEQTVSTLRFTQRAMKIKNDPVVVLNMPPLFTHQYSDGAKQLVEGLQELIEAEYQRGLRDSFTYCSSTTGSVVANHQSQVSDCLHALANAQRLLVAHDHAMAIDHVGRLYNQLNEITRQRVKSHDLVESEGKRQRDVDEEIVSRQQKLQRLEEEYNVKLSSLDTDVAGWEYQLYEARQKQCSDLDVVVQSELARRARIQYEWFVCLEGIASRCVPAIQRSIQGAVAADTKDGAEDLLPLPPTSGSKTQYLKEVREAVTRMKEEVAELEMAHEMVRDDIELAKKQQRLIRNSANGKVGASISPQPRPSSVENMNEEELAAYYDGVPDEDLDERIERLEKEEKALMAQARRGVRRESIRRVRESLRVSSHSRSPQTGGVTITRARVSGNGESGGHGHQRSLSPGRGRDRAGRRGSPSATTVSSAAASGITRTSSSVTNSYADGVMSALSMLDSLKARLQQQGGYRVGKSGAGRTRSRSDSSRSATAASAASGARAFHDPRSGLGASQDGVDADNLPLAQLYNPNRDKENVRRGGVQPAHPHKGPVKYAPVEEDNMAFDVDASDDDEDPSMDTLTSTPVGIAARRRLERQHSRPAVERALYSLHSNSHSPSISLERRSRSRRNY